MKWKLEIDNNKKYKAKIIWDSEIYKKKSEIGQLLKLYYFVVLKDYHKKKLYKNHYF